MQITFELTENGVQVADSLFKKPDAIVSDPDDSFFDSTRGCKAIDVDRLALTNTVESADSLLDSHWIPGKIVVEHDVAKLKVPAFPASLSRDENLAGFSEPFNRFVFGRPMLALGMALLLLLVGLAVLAWLTPGEQHIGA